jgi:hypothetical protein
MWYISALELAASSRSCSSTTSAIVVWSMISATASRTRRQIGKKPQRPPISHLSPRVRLTHWIGAIGPSMKRTTSPTLDESAALELHEQIRKKLLGDRLPAGDLLDPYRPFVAALGKFEKRPKPVLAAM